MPMIEVSKDNLSTLDAISSAKGVSREATLEAAQYAYLDEATRNAILNTPIFYWEEAQKETDPTAPPF